MLIQFGNVLPFIRSHSEVSPATTKKLLALLQDDSKNSLCLELATVVDCGEKFIKATYDLEGDGALVFKCSDNYCQNIDSFNPHSIFSKS